jgi:hypothetical protein
MVRRIGYPMSESDTCPREPRELYDWKSVSGSGRDPKTRSPRSPVLIRETGSTIPFEVTGCAYHTGDTKGMIGRWSENAA